ncbi:hypothetical protein AAVH_29911, partial [Aphelenchoides avenae]
SPAEGARPRHGGPHGRLGLKGVGLGNLGSGLGKIVIGAGRGANDRRLLRPGGLRRLQRQCHRRPTQRVANVVLGIGRGAEDFTNGVGEGGKFLQIGLRSAADELLS